LQTQRTCSTFNAGAIEGAIGIALATVAATAASAAEESRTAIGLLIETLHEWISSMGRVWPCQAELQLNVRREKTPRHERDIDARALGVPRTDLAIIEHHRELLAHCERTTRRLR